MRIVRFCILMFSVAMIMFFVGCEENPTSPDDEGTLQVKFQLDGSWVQFSETQSNASYNTLNNTTLINALDTLSGEFFTLTIPGSADDDWNIDDNDTLALLFVDNDNDTLMSYSELAGDGAELSVEITFYGPVGGTVEGTFSGTLVNPSTMETKSVTEGTFKVRRISDVE